MSGVRKERVGWRDDALCADYPPEMWFPTNAEARRTAKAVCRACPVLEDCLEDALSSPTGRGVRAGMTPGQITKLKQRRAA